MDGMKLLTFTGIKFFEGKTHSLFQKKLFEKLCVKNKKIRLNRNVLHKIQIGIFVPRVHSKCRNVVFSSRKETTCARRIAFSCSKTAA